MSNLREIPLSQIRENPNALRTVNRTTEDYLGLVDSIRKDGVHNPIVVRECTDPTTGEAYFGLVDGLHRFTASQDAGKITIPAHIKSFDEIGVMLAQMTANVHKIETKPVEYSKQLVRILALDPLLTTTELASRLAKSPTWLNDRLGLTKLTDDIAKLVDEDQVNLSNAYALSKLPAEEQPNFLNQAMTMSPQQFIPTVNARVKEIKDAKRQGRDPAAKTEFQPVAHFRGVKEVHTELQNKEVARILTQGCTNVVEAFALGLAWSLNLDPESAQAQRDKNAAREAELNAAKERRKQERLQKKEQEAIEKAAAIQAKVAA